MTAKVTDIKNAAEGDENAELKARVKQLEAECARLNEAGQRLVTIIQRMATALAKISGEAFAAIGQ